MNDKQIGLDLADIQREEAMDMIKRELQGNYLAIVDLLAELLAHWSGEELQEALEKAKAKRYQIIKANMDKVQ